MQDFVQMWLQDSKLTSYTGKEPVVRDNLYYIRSSPTLFLACVNGENFIAAPPSALPCLTSASLHPED